MLSILRKRASEMGLSTRIRLHRSLPDSLALTDSPPVAFVLAYHVLHETGNQEQVLGELAEVLQKGGLLLIAEPFFIVTKSEFRRTVDHAVRAGLTVTGSPCIFLSRTSLLRKS
jgi:ubiquinone/menaquinone biosynthesis C-methylase UbiE